RDDFPERKVPAGSGSGSPGQHARQGKQHLVLRLYLEPALVLPLTALSMSARQVGVQGLEHGETPGV
ncbi:MAG: hypothetical protein ABIO48_00910, partial [Pedococcus sp.]